MPTVTITNPTIEGILQQYRSTIGTDYEIYRNHVYRVYNLSKPYIIEDGEEPLIAIAAAFHDIAIWTHRTFDYLAPSKQLATEYALAQQLNAQDINLIGLLIDEHHKVTKTTSELSNTFRLADWYDVTFGLVGQKYEKEFLKQLYTAFPSKGFHRFLIRESLKHLRTHPFSPLPMFKW